MLPDFMKILLKVRATREFCLKLSAKRNHESCGLGKRTDVKLGEVPCCSPGVAIRSVKRYDLVKIKPTQSEAEH